MYPVDTRSKSFPSMNPRYIHPLLGRSVSYLLKKVLKDNADPPMLQVLPFPNLPRKSSKDEDVLKPPSTLGYWVPPSSSTAPALASGPSPRSKTKIMATLNVTPDSFSDGSDHNSLTTALPYVEES